MIGRAENAMVVVVPCCPRGSYSAGDLSMLMEGDVEESGLMGIWQQVEKLRSG